MLLLLLLLLVLLLLLLLYLSKMNCLQFIFVAYHINCTRLQVIIWHICAQWLHIVLAHIDSVCAARVQSVRVCVARDEPEAHRYACEQQQQQQQRWQVEFERAMLPGGLCTWLHLSQVMERRTGQKGRQRGVKGDWGCVHVRNSHLSRRFFYLPIANARINEFSTSIRTIYPLRNAATTSLCVCE